MSCFFDSFFNLNLLLINKKYKYKKTNVPMYSLYHFFTIALCGKIEHNE